MQSWRKTTLNSGYFQQRNTTKRLTKPELLTLQKYFTNIFMYEFDAYFRLVVYVENMAESVGTNLLWPLLLKVLADTSPPGR